MCPFCNLAHGFCNHKICVILRNLTFLSLHFLMGKMTIIIVAMS